MGAPEARWVAISSESRSDSPQIALIGRVAPASRSGKAARMLSSRFRCRFGEPKSSASYLLGV